jgi:Carbonic anhydrase
MAINASTTERLTACEHDLAILKQHTIEKQEPFAAVLSCADSRVPVESVFDQSIGHIFVTRIAGNIATPEIIASLEYGAGVLGTKVILVMGHGGCGAVKATIQAKEVPGRSAHSIRIYCGLFLPGENALPVLLHADHVPATLLGFVVQRLGKRTHFGIGQPLGRAVSVLALVVTRDTETQEKAKWVRARRGHQ